MAAKMGERQRVLVTGAAGGLGREIALELARRGCAIGLVDIDAAGTGRVAKECRALGADIVVPRQDEVAHRLVAPDGKFSTQ